MASYTVNDDGVTKCRAMIDAHQYVLESVWQDAQPGTAEQNEFLERHRWDDYGSWHLGLINGASEETKGRYGFVFGDFRRVHRSALIACVFRSAEWHHKAVELAAHDLLQHLDRVAGD